MYILIKEINSKKNRKLSEISKRLPGLCTQGRLFFHFVILTLYFLCMFAHLYCHSFYHIAQILYCFDFKI